MSKRQHRHGRWHNWAHGDGAIHGDFGRSRRRAEDVVHAERRGRSPETGFAVSAFGLAITARARRSARLAVMRAVGSRGENTTATSPGLRPRVSLPARTREASWASQAVPST